MADLAQSAVVINRAWTEGGITGKERSCRQVTLTLTGQGSNNNKIPATALGLTGIIEAGTFTKSDNANFAFGAVSADGTYMLLNGAGFAAGDLTGTYTGVVRGYVS